MKALEAEKPTFPCEATQGHMKLPPHLILQMAKGVILPPERWRMAKGLTMQHDLYGLYAFATLVVAWQRLWIN